MLTLLPEVVEDESPQTKPQASSTISFLISHMSHFLYIFLLIHQLLSHTSEVLNFLLHQTTFHQRTTKILRCFFTWVLLFYLLSFLNQINSTQIHLLTSFSIIYCFFSGSSRMFLTHFTPFITTPSSS